MGIPESLRNALKPVTVIVGHYGAGKTNFTVNLALDLSEEGREVTVVDLDVVNPYFRATEQRVLLEEHGVRLVAPVFAEAGTSLDVPSLTGGIVPAIQAADDMHIVIIDAGGDDVGATALGRFALPIVQRDYAMLYVANRFRNLVSDPVDALENLREIEAASHLHVTALANNTHLKGETTGETIRLGVDYATEVSKIADLRVVCTTVPFENPTAGIKDAYRVFAYVKNPWE